MSTPYYNPAPPPPPPPPTYGNTWRDDKKAPEPPVYYSVPLGSASQECLKQHQHAQPYTNDPSRNNAPGPGDNQTGGEHNGAPPPEPTPAGKKIGQCLVGLTLLIGTVVLFFWIGSHVMRNSDDSDISSTRFSELRGERKLQS
ncbi:hypothetical protein LTR37_008188 [Vermiconidia calcicola]|uniref:Uncharacterized protein n=1 Tax=Vermiconidia calcicola TaxID=1690605 RepID=A0ACC3NBG8_9PEZI|nr:hypothetical protein LTR37_008188 [Vermiconidia calcicola]